jgi:parallel beta-helix repeat protein
MKQFPQNLCPLLLAWALVVALWPTGETQAANCLKVSKNLTITNTTGTTLNLSLCAGNYHFNDNNANGIIIIKGSNITVDATGVKLSGSGSGYGVYLNGASAGGTISNVTIKNFAQLSGFKYGMRLENAANLTIQHNVVSANRKTDNTFLDINADLSNTEGGGILLNNVRDSTIGESVTYTKNSPNPHDWVISGSTNGLYNTLQNQNSGVELFNSTNNVVAANIASSNKTWGVRLYNSSGNLLYNNQANNVTRCNPAGCDSAGMLLVQGSSGNRVEGNNLQSSGDGFFIGNQYSTPSNNNYIYNNDGSYSPHNAFEATFGTGNIFEQNKATNSNYGFWLGYSRGVQLIGNTITGNSSDGVNIDRGTNLSMSGKNLVTNNGSSGVAMTQASCGGSVVGCPTSKGHTLSANTLKDNALYGLYVADTTAISLTQANLISGNATGLYFTGLSSVTNLAGNNLVCSSAAKSCTYNAYNNMSSGNNVTASNNWWGTTDQTSIASKIWDGNDDPTKGLITTAPVATTAF